MQGIIKDITGNPIIGATVIAKNQPGLGVTSDMDGKFKIKVGEYDIYTRCDRCSDMYDCIGKS